MYYGIGKSMWRTKKRYKVPEYIWIERELHYPHELWSREGDDGYIIPPHVLDAGGRYKLTVGVSFSKGESNSGSSSIAPGFTESIFELKGSKPHSGRLVITPSSGGIAFSTEFTVEMKGWVSEDTPLNYRFMVDRNDYDGNDELTGTTRQATLTPLTETYTPQDFFNDLILPPGGASKQYRVRITGYVKTRYGIISNATQEIVVRPPPDAQAAADKWFQKLGANFDLRSALLTLEAQNMVAEYGKKSSSKKGGNDDDIDDTSTQRMERLRNILAILDHNQAQLPKTNGAIDMQAQCLNTIMLLGKKDKEVTRFLTGLVDQSIDRGYVSPQVLASDGTPSTTHNLLQTSSSMFPETPEETSEEEKEPNEPAPTNDNDNEDPSGSYMRLLRSGTMGGKREGADKDDHSHMRRLQEEGADILLPSSPPPPPPPPRLLDTRPPQERLEHILGMRSLMQRIQKAMLPKFTRNQLPASFTTHAFQMFAGKFTHLCEGSGLPHAFDIPLTCEVAADALSSTRGGFENVNAQEKEDEDELIVSPSSYTFLYVNMKQWPYDGLLTIPNNTFGLDHVARQRGWPYGLAPDGHDPIRPRRIPEQTPIMGSWGPLWRSVMLMVGDEVGNPLSEALDDLIDTNIIPHPHTETNNNSSNNNNNNQPSASANKNNFNNFYRTLTPDGSMLSATPVHDVASSCFGLHITEDGIEVSSKGLTIHNGTCISGTLYSDYVYVADDLLAQLHVGDIMFGKSTAREFVDTYRALFSLPMLVVLLWMVGMVLCVVGTMKDRKQDLKPQWGWHDEERIVNADASVAPLKKFVLTLRNVWHRDHLLGSFFAPRRHKYVSREERSLLLTMAAIVLLTLCTAMHWETRNIPEREDFVAYGIVAAGLSFPLVSFIYFMFLARPLATTPLDELSPDPPFSVKIKAMEQNWARALIPPVASIADYEHTLGFTPQPELEPSFGARPLVSLRPRPYVENLDRICDSDDGGLGTKPPKPTKQAGGEMMMITDAKQPTDVTNTEDVATIIQFPKLPQLNATLPFGTVKPKPPRLPSGVPRPPPVLPGRLPLPMKASSTNPITDSSSSSSQHLHHLSIHEPGSSLTALGRGAEPAPRAPACLPPPPTIAEVEGKLEDHAGSLTRALSMPSFPPNMGRPPAPPLVEKTIDSAEPMHPVDLPGSIPLPPDVTFPSSAFAGMPKNVNTPPEEAAPIDGGEIMGPSRAPMRDVARGPPHHHVVASRERRPPLRPPVGVPSKNNDEYNRTTTVSVQPSTSTGRSVHSGNRSGALQRTISRVQKELKIADLFIPELEVDHSEKAPPPPPPPPIRGRGLVSLPPSPPGRPIFRVKARPSSSLDPIGGEMTTIPLGRRHDDAGHHPSSSSSSHIMYNTNAWAAPPMRLPSAPAYTPSDKLTSQQAHRGLTEGGTTNDQGQVPSKPCAPPPPPPPAKPSAPLPPNPRIPGPQNPGDRRFEGSHSMPPPPSYRGNNGNVHQQSVAARHSSSSSIYACMSPPPLPREPLPPLNYLRSEQDVVGTGTLPHNPPRTTSSLYSEPPTSPLNCLRGDQDLGPLLLSSAPHGNNIMSSHLRPPPPLPSRSNYESTNINQPAHAHHNFTSHYRRHSGSSKRPQVDALRPAQPPHCPGPPTSELPVLPWSKNAGAGIRWPAELPEYDEVYDDVPPPLPPPIRPLAVGMKPPSRKPHKMKKNKDESSGSGRGSHGPIPQLFLMKPTTERTIPLPQSRVSTAGAIPRPPQASPPPNSLPISRESSAKYMKEMNIKPPEFLSNAPMPPREPPPLIGGRTLARDAFEKLQARKRMIEFKARKGKTPVSKSIATLARSLVIFMALWISIVGSFYTVSIALHLRPQSTFATAMSFLVGVAAFLFIFEAIKCVCITLVSLSQEESRRRAAIKESRRIRMQLKAQVLEEKVRVRGLPAFSHGLTG